MARKHRTKVDTDSDIQLTDTVKGSAQQIWLAGLGAFAKAQQEGTKVFEALVREGNALQRRTLSATDDRLGEVTGKVSKAVDEVSRQATASWDKLEQVFEDRVARALCRLGVPSTRDVQELTDLLNALNAKVAALGADAAAKGAKPAKPGKAAAPRTGKAPTAGTSKSTRTAGRKPAS